MKSCNVITALCVNVVMWFPFSAVFAALTANYGAAGGDHHPQRAAIRGADTTGLPDWDQNHLQNMEVSSEDISQKMMCVCRLCTRIETPYPPFSSSSHLLLPPFLLQESSPQLFRWLEPLEWHFLLEAAALQDTCESIRRVCTSGTSMCVWRIVHCCWRSYIGELEVISPSFLPLSSLVAFSSPPLFPSSFPLPSSSSPSLLPFIIPFLHFLSSEQPGNGDSAPLSQCYHPICPHSKETPATLCLSGLTQQDP